jgi:hypothetical protein
MFEDLMDEEEVDENLNDSLAFDGVQGKDPLGFQADETSWLEAAMDI